MAEHPPDPPRDDKTPDPEPTPGPGDSVGHYELADHPDELDDAPAPPPAVPGPVPTPPAGPEAPAPVTAPGAAPPATGGDIPRCPNCHQDITGSMLGGNCPHCGKRITADQFAGQQSSGNAVASLVLGILSLPTCFCCYGFVSVILGGLAVHFGRKGIQQIAEGHAPPTSEGMAKAGHICGIIGVVLGCGLALFYAATQLIAFALEF